MAKPSFPTTTTATAARRSPPAAAAAVAMPSAKPKPKPKPNQSLDPAPAEEEEEDYMSMALPSLPPAAEKETYTQRRTRLARESLASQPLSSAALAARATASRTAALATHLPADSKGAQMMARLGYKPGTALGAEGRNGQARVEPLGLEVREGKEGVGMEGERKRKIREEMDQGEKRVKVDEEGYRERVGREREEKRLEGCWWGGMKVLEGLEVEGGEGEGEGDGDHEGRKRRMKNKKKRVNLLYRPLVREREEAERERRARYDLLQSLSRDRNYEDPEEDGQDRLVFGTEEVDGAEDDGDDEELEQYLTLEPKERLARVVAELREKWWYCLWCKSRYKTEAMEDCPGPEEEDHD